jgi:hypothetical protein
MSIVVSVKVFDGLVLGADSQTQVFVPGPSGVMGSFVKAYGNARKLFPLAKLPIAVLTYGVGNLGKKSLEGVLLQFSDTILDEGILSVENVATRLFEYVRQGHEAAFQAIPAGQRPVLGLLVAGFANDPAQPVGKNHICEEWEFVLPQDNAPRRVRSADDFGAAWRGAPVWFSRLFFGIDARLTAQVKAAGAPENIVEQLSKGMQMPIIFESMPLQDAVDFAEFVLNVTIGASRFEVGVPICAAPLDIAIIKRETGFRWIRRKPLELQMEG